VSAPIVRNSSLKASISRSILPDDWIRWVGSYDPTRTVVRWELEPQTVNELHPSGPKKAGTGTRVRFTARRIRR
jgi:hypothetical protein